MDASDLATVTLAIVVGAIPLGLSMWALLDAARRPEWAFALVGKSRTVWVGLTAVGFLFCGPGTITAIWYLVRVRPVVAAAEIGKL